jgi:hypothetical protein
MSEPGDIGSLLKALIEHGPSLRAAGFSSVTLPDGTAFTLRASAPVTAPGADAQPPEADDADPIAEAQREERELRAKWNEQWRRMTLSSGGRIPPFPSNLGDARRALATLFGGRSS